MLNTRRTIATLAGIACLGVGGWALAGGTSGGSATPSVSTTGAAKHGGHTPASAEALAKITVAVTKELPGATVRKAKQTATGFRAKVITSDGARKRVTLSSDFVVTEIANAPARHRGACRKSRDGGTTTTTSSNPI